MTHRTFRDVTDLEWDVWEVHPTLTDRRLLADRRGVARSTKARRTGTVTRASLPEKLHGGWLAFRSGTESAVDALVHEQHRLAKT